MVQKQKQINGRKSRSQKQMFYNRTLSSSEKKKFTPNDRFWDNWAFTQGKKMKLERYFKPFIKTYSR